MRKHIREVPFREGRQERERETPLPPSREPEGKKKETFTDEEGPESKKLIKEKCPHRRRKGVEKGGGGKIPETGERGTRRERTRKSNSGKKTSRAKNVIEGKWSCTVSGQRAGILPYSKIRDGEKKGRERGGNLK